MQPLENSQKQNVCLADDLQLENLDEEEKELIAEGQRKYSNGVPVSEDQKAFFLGLYKKFKEGTLPKSESLLLGLLGELALEKTMD